MGILGSEQEGEPATSEMGRIRAEFQTAFEDNLGGAGTNEYPLGERAIHPTPASYIQDSWIVLESPVHGQQEGAAYGHRPHLNASLINPRLFLFNLSSW